MNSGGGGGGGRDDGSEGSGGGAGSGGAATGLIGMMNSNNSRSLFTVSQWQELEHQALIFKYMMAGLPVPPELVLPIQKSLDSISQRFFHHPTMGYCSLYGKKVDPEPGRCRRTDGKKWRCSKDAYPDSKYCERHMHRGRNRSRKPVESQQQQSTILTESSSSAVTSSLTGARTGSGAVSFQNLPLATAAVLSNSDSQRAVSGTSQSHYQLDSIPYAIPNKDYRYLQGMKPDMGEHSFFSEPSSGSNRAHQVDTSLDNAWSLMPSGVPPVSALKLSENSMIASEYPLNSFFTTEYNSPSGGEPVKQEGQGQSLRPFFDEWPRTRESWSGLEDKRSNQTSFSTTQLSISIPMASSDFNAPTSRSPHDH